MSASFETVRKQLEKEGIVGQNQQPPIFVHGGKSHPHDLLKKENKQSF